MLKKEAFQSAIRGELRRSGIIGSVASELRRQVFDAFNETTVGIHRHTKIGHNLEQAAIRSLIFEYLKCDGLQQTASVLAAESCFFDDNFLSRRDVLKAYGIIPNSNMHSMLMSNTDTDKNMNSLDDVCYKDTTIHTLLFHAAALSMDLSKISVSTQTKSTMESQHMARVQLDRQLEMIDKKYKQSSKDLYDMRGFEGRLETKLISIQKECDERAQREMQQKMKHFQDNIVVSMRKEEEVQKEKELNELRIELKQEYDQKVQQFLNRQDEMKRMYETKEREQEFSLMKARERLTNNLDQLKQRELNVENNLELERKKLQIEEQRVRHILMTAEAKLDFAEKKEKAFEVKMAAEYDRIRSAAKQTFEDASNTAKKQSDLYTKELKEMNILRKAMSNDIEKSNQMEVQISQLRQEKNALNEKLESSQKEIQELRSLIKEKDCKMSEDRLLFNKQYRDIESKLLDKQRDLSNRQREEELKQLSNANLNANLQTSLKSTQQQLKEVKSDYEHIALEKSILVAELEETKRLFERSQEALMCKAMIGKHEANIHMEMETKKALIRPGYKGRYLIPKAVRPTRDPTKEFIDEGNHNEAPSRGIPSSCNPEFIKEIFIPTSNDLGKTRGKMPEAIQESVTKNLSKHGRDENYEVLATSQETHMTSPAQDGSQNKECSSIYSVIKEDNVSSSKRSNVEDHKEEKISPSMKKNTENNEVLLTTKHMSNVKEIKNGHEMKPLMVDMTLSMIEQDPVQKVDNPSVRSVGTHLTWDVSPTKQAQEDHTKNELKSNSDPSLNYAQSVPKDPSKVSSIATKSSFETKYESDNEDQETQHNLRTPREDVLSRREESTNIYDMSEFEHESSMHSNGEGNMSKAHDTMKKTIQNHSETHFQTQPIQPEYEDSRSGSARQDSNSYTSEESAGRNKGGDKSESMESYKTSSQYESSCSAGIEVYNYKTSDKQTDWW